jgi:uncharacterized protein (TIGR00290 family)
MALVAKRRVLVSWSSGKDSAWSLHVLRQHAGLDVVGLLTTVNREFDRVAMHGVRSDLLLAQAAAAGVEPWLVPIPSPCSNAEYETIMAEQMSAALRAGIDAVAFGDLFLADVRAYRERQLAGSGIEPLFPLWGNDTARLARDVQASGLRAVVTCVDLRALDESFAGRQWDADFLAALPAGVDPCGERGEFHTFVYAGPMLSEDVDIRVGEVVTRDGFVFADLLPASSVVR